MYASTRSLATAVARRVTPDLWLPRVALAVIAGLAVAVAVSVAGPGLAALLAVVIVAGCAAVAMPGLLFAAFLLIPFYKAAIQPYIPIDITAVLAVTNMLQLVPVLRNRRRLEVSRAGVALWIGLGAMVLAGTLYAPDEGDALGAAVTFWALLVVPLLAAGLRVGSDSGLVRQFLWAFYGMGVATVVLGLAQMSSADRLVVLGMNTIQVSVAVLMLPLLGVSFARLDGRRTVRAATILLIPAAFVVALASGSRGPLLMLAILAGLVGLHHLVRRRAVNRRLVASIAGAVVATVGVLASTTALLPALSVERFTLFGSFLASQLAGDSLGSTGDTSSATRVRLFSLAMQIFSDHPLVGAGPTGFQVLSTRYVGPYLADRYPHNSLLQFAAEFGLVGITLFLAIVTLAITRKIPPGPAWWSVRTAFGFFLLNSMLSGDVLEDRMLWGFLLLLLCARVVPTASPSGPRPDSSPLRSPRPPARTLT